MNQAANQFVGRAIRVIETTRNYNGHDYTEADLDLMDPIVAQVEAVCGTDLRWKLPGMFYTEEFKLGRTNIHVQRQHDGTWRIERISEG